MPTLVILATTDSSLAESWERQLPPGRSVLRLDRDTLPSSTPGVSAVVVLDATAQLSLPARFSRCPTVFVGEPRSLPFEEARLAKRARIFLSYEESATRLIELLPLLEELAEKQSIADMLSEKTRRVEAYRPSFKPQLADTSDLWDFLEGAVENLDARERLLAEFRRASRQILRASHAVFFLKEIDGFRADRGTSFFPTDDPLVTFFENHPAVIDAINWDSPTDPVGELAVRNRIALWGARLLIPIHDNGRLLGLVALGVRDDGLPYDEADKVKAISFARLLRHFLAKCSHFSRLNSVAGQVALGAKYLPGTIVLGPHENAPRHVPLVVRDLIGQARHARETCRVLPTNGQPFRATAGIVNETGGVWAFWEEASGEVYDSTVRERKKRLGVLRELALTLNHELGNALVSLTTFRQAGADRPMPPALMQTVKSDVVQLEALNTNLALMQSLHEASSSELDVREVAQAVAMSLNVRVDVPTDPIILRSSKLLIEFALRSLLRTLAENRAEGFNDLALKVRSTGSGSETTALFAIKGRNLELEGILPEPVEDAVPNQGRLGVFLAKEILRLHNGEVHAGPGLECVEILMSLRNLCLQ